jgi:hypothetical protein
MEPDTAVLTGKEQDRVAMNLRLRIAPPQSGQGER